MNKITAALAGTAFGCVATIACQDILSPSAIRIMGNGSEPAVFISTDAVGGGKLVVRDNNGNTAFEVSTGILKLAQIDELEKRVRALESQPTATPTQPAATNTPLGTPQVNARLTLSKQVTVSYVGTQRHHELPRNVGVFKLRNETDRTVRISSIRVHILDRDGDRLVDALAHRRIAEEPKPSDRTTIGLIKRDEFIHLWVHLDDPLKRSYRPYEIEFPDGSTIVIGRN